jgi:DNA-binding response OmpR family regulator
MTLLNGNSTSEIFYMDHPLNIAVIEDYDHLRKTIITALETRGHRVISLDCAEALSESNATDSLDVLIVDLNLPGEDGMSLTKRMRCLQPNIGIVILTGETELSSKVEGYASGADIYLTKPVHMEELYAAVNAIGRRVKRISPADNKFRLHLKLMKLEGPSNSVLLSAQELSILVALSRSANNRLETWQLLDLNGTEASENSKSRLEVQMVRLRKKFMQCGCTQNPLRPIRGFGYQLCIPLLLV